MKLGKKTLSVVLSMAMVASVAASSTAFSVSADSTSTTTKTASSFSWDNASVYFLLTDRFNNGDTSNDHSYNRGLNQDGTVATDMVTDAAMFQGGDFKGITQKINEGYFDNLGVNALWVTAPYEQAHGYVVGGNSSTGYPHYAYHGYYLLDYTNTDANYGTVEEFREMVDTAHEHGIRIVMDVVMNHPGYATMYDMNEYGFGSLKNNWADVYYNWSGISNSAFDSVISYNTNADKWSKWWGSDWIRAGIAGYTAGDNSDLLTGVNYLPDFKTESTTEVDIPEILKTKWTQEGVYEQKVAYTNAWFEATGYPKTPRYYQICWLSAWVSEFGIDGFRCDTAKHVEKESWGALKTECEKALNEWKAENPDKVLDDSDFWMTGENYGMALDPSSDYYTTGGFDSMINFENGGGVPKLENIAETYQTYADTINTNSNFNVMTYISSHDDTMANYGSNKDMYYQGTAFQLMPGAIQIYYGDETNRQKLSAVKVGSTRIGLEDHALRSFMNWSDTDTELLAHWQKVGQFRNNHVAVGAGANATITSSDENGVAFTRTYDKDGVQDAIAAVIASTADTDVTVDVSSIFEDGTKVVNAYDGTEAVVANGSVTFNSGAHKTILVEKYVEEPATEPATESTEATNPTDSTSSTNPTEASSVAPTQATTTTTVATLPKATQVATTVKSTQAATTVTKTTTTTTTATETATGKVATGDPTATTLLMMTLLAAGGAVVITRKKIEE
ncbi:MAG: alpha-amylase family glycosyl hydrolase [Acutalibacteraceae bacterium]|nr:alpha-amylase family glycosyl hydrolase [Acutalibacteraceae bacterium]